MIKHKKINNWLIIGLLLILLILFFNSKQKKPLQSISNVVAKPFARIFSGAGFWLNKKIYFISSIGELKNQNEQLFNENLKLKAELVGRNETENENRILREEIGLMAQNDFETEACFILGQTLSQNRKVIYLDKGSANGIKKGMPVIIGGGILVGKTSKIYKTSSEVELVLDRNNKINAEVQEIQVKGIVQGEYGTSSTINMIPQTAEIESGQTVITSGLGDVYPRGLLIGYVGRIEMTVDQLFKKASLELPVQFKNLRMVWIIKGKK